MKKRLIPVLLVLAMLLGMIPVLAAEPALSGELGDSLAWELEPIEGVLTVTGEGAIPDFSYSDGAPWYPYRSRVFKAVLDEKITAIGAYAFNECSRLTEVDAAHSTLSAIGAGAMSNCVQLETVSFIPGESLTVGDDAFYGCTALKALDLSAKEGTVGSGAFTYCMALEEIVLPGRLTKLEPETFSNCQNLAKITLPEGLESIGKSCFRACAALEAIRIPATVSAVDRYAFSGCEKLTATFEGAAPAFAPAKDASASFAPGATLRFPYQAEGWSWPLCKGYETEIDYPDLDKFLDLEAGAWYVPSVQHVYYNGLMNGISETAFSPSNPMTRGQLVTVLYRIEGSPDVEAENPFKDVAENAYYYDAVRWAQSNSIVTGLSAETFGPDSRITRQQMCAILYRYAAMLKLPLSQRDPLTDFNDTDQLADYAKDPMSWCVAMGFVNGKPGGLLDPAGNATRAEIAKVLTLFDRFLTGEELRAQDNWEQSIVIPEPVPEIDREDPLYIYAREIFDGINAKRTEIGLTPFVWNDRIFLAAQVRAKELPASEVLVHTRPDGRSYSSVFEDYEIESTTRNEIIAKGFSTAQALVDKWADAPATSSVISAVVYSQAAVGVAEIPPTEEGGESTYYYALLVIG